MLGFWAQGGEGQFEMNIAYNKKHLIVLFFIVGVLIYSPSIEAPFIYDDHELILASPLARDVSALWQDRSEAGLRFLTYLTFCFNYSLHGHFPLGYHLINIALHIGNALLIVNFVEKLVKTPRMSRSFSPQGSEVTATLAGLLFLVHPLSTSAVNYIWQRAELLTGFFYFAAVIAYLKARLERLPAYGYICAVLFALGMLAKGTMISLPFVLLTIEAVCFGVSQKWLKPMLWLFGLGAGFNFYMYLKVYWGRSYLEWIVACLTSFTGMVLTAEHIWTQLYVVWRYLLLTVLPWGLNFDHDVEMIMTLSDPRAWVSLLAIIAVTAGAVVYRGSRRMFLLGWLWFLITLAPASLMGGREPMWEYRMYVPLIGLLLATLSLILGVMPLRKVVIILSGVVVIFSAFSFMRNMTWKSPETLWLDTIRKSPLKPNPYHQLGSHYLTEGRSQEARPYFEKAVLLAPDFSESYNNLGLIARDSGEFDLADKYFRTAIRYRPALIGSYINLAYLSLSRGDDVHAEKILRQSLEVRPTEGAFAALGKVYMSRGEWTQAREYLNRALGMNPESAQTLFWYGELWQHLGDPVQARLMFDRAVNLSPRLKQFLPGGVDP